MNERTEHWIEAATVARAEVRRLTDEARDTAAVLHSRIAAECEGYGYPEPPPGDVNAALIHLMAHVDAEMAALRRSAAPADEPLPPGWAKCGPDGWRRDDGVILVKFPGLDYCIRHGIGRTHPQYREWSSVRDAMRWIDSEVPRAQPDERVVLTADLPITHPPGTGIVVPAGSVGRIFREGPSEDLAFVDFDGFGAVCVDRARLRPEVSGG